MGGMFYTFKCKDCGYEKWLLYGFDKDGSKIHTLYCPKCMQFKKLTFKKGTYENGIPDRYCEECGTKLEDIKTEPLKNDKPKNIGKHIVNIDLYCPKCHSLNKELPSFGFWD